MMDHKPIDTSGQDLSGIPVDQAIMFTNHKNVHKPRIEKRQTKLVEKLSFIKPFLKEDEKVLLVTTGCSPVSLMEQLVTGWIIFYLKQSLFVFTNKRIFHVPTKKNYTYRNSIAEIRYADCNSIAVKGRSLVVVYKNGEKEKFLFMAGRERRKIKALLTYIPFEGEQSAALRRTHLCPRCTKILVQHQYQCPHCHFAFKDKAEGRRISIIYPGGGYFYTRHPFLGIGDAVTEFFLLLFVVASLVGVFQGAEGALFGVIFFSIALAFEKMITVYHSNHFIKEYIPKEKEVRPLRVAARV